MPEPRIIDVHQHVGPWPFPGCWGEIEENLRLMALRGVDAALISSTRAVVQDMVAGNAELAQAIEGHDRLYAYVTVNPTVSDLSRRELERYAGHPQFVGAKLHTHYSGCGMGDPRTAAMIATLADWGRPLLIHTWGAGEVAALRLLAQRHRGLPLIMAHAGGDAWRQGIAAAEECPNLYLDFAGSTPYRGAIARALERLGPERILFGSDATLLDPLYMLAAYAHVPMAEEQRALVMGANAQRLFGLAQRKYEGS